MDSLNYDIINGLISTEFFYPFVGSAQKSQELGYRNHKTFILWYQYFYILTLYAHVYRFLSQNSCLQEGIRKLVTSLKIKYQTYIIHSFAYTLWLILRKKKQLCWSLHVLRHVDRFIYSRQWSCLVAIILLHVFVFVCIVESPYKCEYVNLWLWC